MDFKIKFDTIKHRNNAVEFFERIGISWSGALVSILSDSMLSLMYESLVKKKIILTISTYFYNKHTTTCVI